MGLGVGVEMAERNGVEDLVLRDTGDFNISFSLGAIFNSMDPITKTATKRKRTCQTLKLDFFIRIYLRYYQAF